jgi:O-succinylbenzoic acid--CoA ligase
MLLLNGTPYTRNDIVNMRVDALPRISTHERYTLLFCQQWLQGQTLFSIKTSGSTGKPKIITLKRSQMVASAKLTGQRLSLRPGDSALVCLSTEHIAGMMMLVRGFELRLSLTVITPSRNPLKDFSDKAAFTFTSMVPLQLQEVFTKAPDKIPILNKMRAILVGGAPISENVLTKIRSLDSAVYHTYGMTETVSHIAFRRLNGDNASDYFFPLEGVELGLSDQECLTIISPTTDNKTILTNDRVELRSNGLFRWLGRLDNVINTGSFKVQAEKVEMALEKIFQRNLYDFLVNRRFFVGPLSDPDYGQRIVAVLEGPPISRAFQSDIKSSLKNSRLLKPYEIPKAFKFLPTFLETSTGKVDRQANLVRLSINAVEKLKPEGIYKEGQVQNS